MDLRSEACDGERLKQWLVSHFAFRNLEIPALHSQPGGYPAESTRRADTGD
jgi:hypothetical protein